MAVVNFRLIAHNIENGKPVTAYYRNTRNVFKAERQMAGCGLAGNEGAEKTISFSDCKFVILSGSK